MSGFAAIDRIPIVEIIGAVDLRGAELPATKAG
jgi:hypothetical protein